ncbi:hypothetical protein KL921_003725 [Ogataea angusta]|nr:hypothetical protein KL921_003725 [Ogataea angusta]
MAAAIERAGQDNADDGAKRRAAQPDDLVKFWVRDRDQHKQHVDEQFGSYAQEFLEERRRVDLLRRHVQHKLQNVDHRHRIERCLGYRDHRDADTHEQIHKVRIAFCDEDGLRDLVEDICAEHGKAGDGHGGVGKKADGVGDGETFLEFFRLCEVRFESREQRVRAERAQNDAERDEEVVQRGRVQARRHGVEQGARAVRFGEPDENDGDHQRDGARDPQQADSAEHAQREERERREHAERKELELDDRDVREQRVQRVCKQHDQRHAHADQFHGEKHRNKEPALRSKRLVAQVGIRAQRGVCVHASAEQRGSPVRNGGRKHQKRDSAVPAGVRHGLGQREQPDADEHVDAVENGLRNGRPRREHRHHLAVSVLDLAECERVVCGEKRRRVRVQRVGPRQIQVAVVGKRGVVDGGLVED